MRIALLLALGLVVSSTTTVKADVIATFDSNVEGWTSTGAALTFVNTGGNPGGFLSLTDNVTDYMTVFTPAGLLGNWVQYLGGTLSFDARNLNGSVPDLNSSPLFGTVTITGIGGTASQVLGGTGQPPADNLWHTYSASLNPALWSGNLAGALSGVTELGIVLESNNTVPAESNGFDNFIVTATTTTTVPEPSTTLVLTILGFIGLSSRILNG
ncbi:MAG: hypothetical protein GPI92_17015 [Microcystis aeruginosa K13-06]|uniref:PEP-CTERM sorting domain-containing protein n=1 Tax=Microcystis aeruginosa 11-30S32 TaxID=2358142 RepID=A0A510PD01_MICAE|nr:hypothetical protein [Microcystis aeruginosa]NCR77196.1 hypothetical protein [Microcystis aeruginosa K13-06]GCA91613.1 PEP-CTERM sorting domain-containing protein [Microcystis aeruginosa 11-30S32]